MAKLTIDMIKILYFRFCTIFGERFNRNHTEDYMKVWYQTWVEGLAGINPYHFKEALQYCAANFEWSPSIAEFRSVCEDCAGIPNEEEFYQAMIRQDFALHPLVKTFYDKIGSWNVQRDSEKDLRAKFKVIFKAVRSKDRLETVKEALEDKSCEREIEKLPPKRDIIKDVGQDLLPGVIHD